MRQAPRRAPLSPPVRRVLTLRGAPLSYSLRMSARARVVRLVIRPESGLEVVAPRGTPQARIDQVLGEKARWITATLERVAREASAAVPPPITEGATVRLAGRELRLALRVGAPPGRYRAALAGETLTLTLAEGSQEAIRHALEAWYRRQAGAIFAERLAICNSGYGFAYGRVAIKAQKSRWGSCSRRGNLNFNWRLLLAPLSVLDYVVIHELCHLRELNHSARFWVLVARSCPDYKTPRRWLRAQGRTLRL
jgi:predicted metal-dependent hydrolase